MREIIKVKELETVPFNFINDVDNQWVSAVIVIKQGSYFIKEYSEYERSYLVYKQSCKAFLPNMIGRSIFASCLDGTDQYLRLDACLRGNENNWKIEKVYLCEVLK